MPTDATAAAAYFRERPLERLLALARDKYASLGRMGGTAALADPSAAEITALRDFFGEQPRLDRQGRAIIPLAKLDAQLQQTRFACDLLELLEAYFGERPATRHEVAAQHEAHWQQFLTAAGRRVHDAVHGLPNQADALQWWEQCLAEAGGAALLVEGSLNLIRQAYLECVGASTQPLLNGIAHVARALGDLPARTGAQVRLPVFAHRVCGDPHAFDPDRLTGRLLERGILSLHPSPEQVLAGVTSPAIRRDMVLSSVGLQRDDLSSTVLVAYLEGTLALEELNREGAVVSLPLRQVLRLPCTRARKHRAFVLENPAVFGTLVDRLESSMPCEHRPTLICTSGQPSVAALRLLDRLSAVGCRLYYGGDFDGPGIAITANLMRRYGAALTPWRMDCAAFQLACGSGKPRRLRPRELAHLEQARDLLPGLVGAMLGCGHKAYQEALVDILVDDLIPTC